MASGVDITGWLAFLDALKRGEDRSTAFLDSGMSEAAVEEVLRKEPQRQFEYEEAKTAALRAKWTMTELEAVMNAIVKRESDGQLKNILRRRKRDMSEFLRLVERDNFVKAMYAEARTLQAEAYVDEILQAAGSEDKTAKQIIDTLKWLMSVMNEKFKTANRESKKVQDDAGLESLLENGRRRVEELYAKRRKVTDDTGQAVSGE